jgi:hypothetical protein
VDDTVTLDQRIDRAVGLRRAHRRRRYRGHVPDPDCIYLQVNANVTVAPGV